MKRGREIFDEEGEKALEIYISKADYQRLDGDGSFGDWDEHIYFSKKPSEHFCIKTRVPESSVVDDIFDPALSEPDMVVEWCQEVSKKELEEAKIEKDKEEKKKWLSVKKGQTVWYELSIAGYTTHEESVVGRVKKKEGIFYIDNGPGNDPSGPFYIKNGRLVDDEASRILGTRVRILTEKPKKLPRNS